MRHNSLVEDFRKAAAHFLSIEQLEESLCGVSLELGFQHVALLHHASLSEPNKGYVRVHNYPSEWVEELTSGGLYLHDPVHAASRRSNAAFLWREIPSLLHLSPEQRMIMERSKRFGLTEGLTVPLNVPSEPSGSCSFAVRSSRGLPRSRIGDAELIGAYALNAARRLRTIIHPRPRPHLSRREVQCLRLIAAGKSDRDIAAILGISVETVRQYVKRARSAYEVSTRTQLVLSAMRDGWIALW